MKVKVANASSKKTRELIKETFAELIKEKKSLEKITVTELVKKADITRGAFYTHFDNIYEVADEFQNEALETCFKNMEKINSIKDIDKLFNNIFAYLKENQENYEKLLSSDEPLIFMNRLNKIICHHVYETLTDKIEKNIKISISFFVDGTLNLILRYFKKEIDLSLDEINEYIKDMFKKMFKG